MASFYSNLSSEGDMLPNAYSLNQKLASYPSSEHPNNNVYGSRDEMMFIPRYSDGNTVISNTHIYSKESVNDSEQIPQHHGLSLSLGSQEPGLVQLPSGLNQYTNSSFCSLLTSDMQSEVQLSKNDGLKNNVQYLSFDLAGKTRDTVKFGAVGNFENLIHQEPEVMGTFCNSKYLNAAQDLLGELVNVHKALKQSKKGQSFKSIGQGGSTGADVRRDESNTIASHDLSPSERHDLQNKMTKLLSMLDEVRSYVNRRSLFGCFLRILSVLIAIMLVELT
ncbi:hypothetical protein RD792_000971 [Penstemon davidsonii]|uniref:POX domain-containing protein n=1 Tax=Penstemon davidsonii TaxID=160366 RepID=A0ABR0DMG9_9LAMI|nr:hypothetical protein RD792_000971 [Penstemon davidsonii]